MIAGDLKDKQIHVFVRHFEMSEMRLDKAMSDLDSRFISDGAGRL